MSDKEEISIAAQLKFFCSSSGEEQDLENSGQLLHQLACVHRHRSPDKISLIQSAGLLNAAILRKPSDVHKIRQDLTDLCQHVLHLANADNKKADLIEKSTILKDSIKRLRKDVSEKLKSVEPILNYSNKKDLEYREKDKIAKMESIQHVITVRYNTIMWDLSKFCENVLGTRPCEFAVIGIGSLARSEITPYSDFEHVIVIEDTNDFGGNLEYFRWFSVIFQLVILNLGETIIPSLHIYNLNDRDSELGDWFHDSVTPRGISFDGMMPHACKFPLGRQTPTKDKPWTTELIKPVTEMLEYLKREEDLKNGYHLGDILTQTCYVYGNKTIFDQFDAGVLDHKRKQSQDENIKLVTKQVKEDLDSFSSRFTLSNLQTKNSLNIKKDVYRSSTIFVSALAKLYNLSASSCMEIIKELSLKCLISDFTKHKLKFAVAVSCEARLKWYMKMKSQCDFVQYQTKNNSQLLEFITMIGKNTIINYFQITYCLQCELMNRLKYRFKSHIYLHPELINMAICSGLKLNRELNLLLKQTNILDLPNNKRFQFQSSLQRLGETCFYRNISPKLGISIKWGKEKNYSKENGKKLNTIAEYLYQVERVGEAIDFIKQALKIYRQFSLTDDCDYANMLHLMGLFLINHDKYIEAKEYCEESYQILNSLSTDVEFDEKFANVSVSFGICIKHTNDNKCGDLSTQIFRQTIKTFTNLILLQRGQNDIPPISLLTKMAECFLHLEQFEDALFYYNQVSEIFVSTVDSNYDKELADLYRLRGLCHAHCLNYKKSLQDLKQSYNLHEKVSLDKRGIIKTSNSVACLFIKSKDNEESNDKPFKIFDKALREPKSLCKDSLYLAEKLHTFVVKEKRKNFFEKSVVYLELILLLYRNVNLEKIKEKKACTLEELGNLLFSMQEYNKSRQCFYESLRLYSNKRLDVKKQEKIADLFRKIGNCLIKTNKFDAAMDWVGRAQIVLKKEISNNPGISRNRQTISIQIANSLIQFGRYEESKKYYEEAEKMNLLSSEYDQRHKFFDDIFYTIKYFQNDQSFEELKIGFMNSFELCFNNVTETQIFLDDFNRLAQSYKSFPFANDVSCNIAIKRCFRLLATRHMDFKKYHFARICFEEYLNVHYSFVLYDECDQGVADALYKIGICLMQTKQYHAALEKFNQVIQYLYPIASLFVIIDTEIGDMWIKIGDCLKEVEEYFFAIKYYREAATIFKVLSTDSNKIANIQSKINFCSEKCLV